MGTCEPSESSTSIRHRIPATILQATNGVQGRPAAELSSPRTGSFFGNPILSSASYTPTTLPSNITTDPQCIWIESVVDVT